MKKIKITLAALLCGAILVSCSGGKTDGEETAPVTEEKIKFYYSDGIGEDGYLSDEDPLSYVQLCEYKGIKVSADEYQVSEAEITTQFNSILNTYTTVKEVKDRAVKDGDTVNIDYVGSVGGVEFEGGSTEGQGTEVTIGETQYIDDFLEQLIGHKPGETFDVEVTFPASYPSSPTLAGKDAVFVTTINYIVEKEKPTVDEEFLKKNFPDEDFKTEEDLKAFIKEDIKGSKIEAYLQDYVIENSPSTLPDSVLIYQENCCLAYYQQIANQYGMTLDGYLRQMGYGTRDAFMMGNYDALAYAAREISTFLAIAEKEGLTATDEEVETFVKETVSEYTDTTLKDYKEAYGMPYLRQAVLRDEVTRLLAEHAVLG